MNSSTDLRPGQYYKKILGSFPLQCKLCNFLNALRIKKQVLMLPIQILVENYDPECHVSIRRTLR